MHVIARINILAKSLI